MANGKIPTSILIPVVVVVLVAVLSFLGTIALSNAGEISDVKAETKGNTRVLETVSGRLERIEGSLDRLEERFQTRPKKD